MSQGHIRRQGDGSWEIKFDLGRDPLTGRRITKYRTFRGNKREAQAELTRLLSQRDNGSLIEPSKVTVAAFLDRWLEYMRARVSPKTHERYTDICRNNLVPGLGAIVLTKLQPVQITDAFANALSSGRRDGKGGLSPHTVHYMHRVLRHALQQAVRWQMLARNPTDAVEAPKIERKQMMALDASGTAALLEAARKTNLFMPILLGVLCGLRRGEITALRWRSVDLKRGELSIIASTEQTKRGVREKPPKSGRGRSVALPSLAVDELRQHRVKQAEDLLKLGVRLTDDHHVVMRGDAMPLQPRSVTHMFEVLLRQRGLTRMRFHDLRHSHATHLLANGVHPKIAQERLGHSSIAITLDLYSHVLPGMQADAAARVDDTLRAALEKHQRAGWEMGGKSGIVPTR
jgi:integrase